MNGRQTFARVLIGLALVAAEVVVLPFASERFSSPVQAAAAPVQFFFTPVKEAQLLPLLNQTSGNGAPASPMHTVLSMVATRDNTIVYYDHWEDGFEANLGSPVQSTTLVLGDGIASNGCAGAYFPTPVTPCNNANDVINAGNILNKREDNIVIPRVASSVYWDGGDKIGASRTIAMTRSSWASGSNTLMGDATEIYDTTFFGTLFTLPVGENPATPTNPPYALSSNNLFSNTVPMVMASEDNTTVSLDYDGDGTTDASTTLNAGQAFTAPLTAVILAGGTVISDKPVQVQLMTGNQGSTYAFDGFTLFPTELWSTSYYTPVSRTCDNPGVTGPEDSHVWLHNPNATSITVNYQDALTSGTITLLPRQTTAYTTVNSSGNNPSGSHFWTTNGSKFAALGTMDSDLGVGESNSAWDWGYTLVPETSLSTAVIVGWGPGRDPTSATNPTENGNPVWVTPVAATTVFVDYDGNPATGLLGPPGAKYDQAISMNPLESRTIYDPDGNQTGLKVYTTDGTRIAVAWGQDTCTASAGAPGLDVGTTVLPLASLDFSKSAALAPGGDLNGNGVVDIGDTLLYTVSVFNVSNITASNIKIVDTPDPNTTYVASSTLENGTTPIADDGTGTPFPLDGPGVTVGTLQPNGATSITFKATVNPLPDGVTSVTNNAVVTSSVGVTPARVTTPVRIPALEVTKVSDPENDPVQPGDKIDYTIEVTNTSDTIQTGITVSDPLPPGTTYVSNSTLINAPSQPIRSTEYYIGGGDGFDGTTFDLVLDRPLAPNYFVIIQGSGTLNGSSGGNYVRLTQDPLGTGDLDPSSGPSVIRLHRDTAASTWIGVVTVVESVTDQTTEGFRLLDVQAVAHGAGATGGSDTSGTAWTALGAKVLLMGGFNGAGCSTAETDPKDLGTCQTRLYPSGSNVINWARDANSVNSSLDAATSTVMVVEWGSSWTVQRVNVTGSNGGDKIDVVGEYDTAAITAVARDHTWVWGTGTMTDGKGDQLKRNGEGQVITLGNGVTQNANESPVAVGGYDPKARSFDVYVMTHPNLKVDHRFKPDGDKDAASVNVTVDTASANRFGLAYTGNNAGNANTPSGLFSARYVSNNAVQLQQQRTDEDWAAWVQGIDFADVEGPTTGITGGAPPNLASGYTLEPGQSMTVTFSVTANDPLPSGQTQIVNTVSVTSAQDPTPTTATVIDDVGSVIGDTLWYDLDGDGVQDPGETGIPGVTVRLTPPAGVDLGAGAGNPITTVTDANGYYQFVVQNTGAYAVAVVGATLPAGLTPTGDPDEVGTCTVCDGVSTATIASIGDVIDTVDFGYRPTGTISGTVYDDLDTNGDQNGVDPGLQNISVGLYYSDGVTPVLASNGSPLVATTDVNGFYRFTNLPGGDYVVRVDPSGSTLPFGSTNKEDPDGPTPNGDSRSAVTLPGGGSVVNQDFGYVNPGLFTKAVDKATAVPGDTLTYTLKVRRPGNDLLSNVIVSDATPTGTTYNNSATPTPTSQPTVGTSGTVTWNLGSNTAGINGSAPGVVLVPASTTIVAERDTHIWGNNPNDNSGASAKLNADSDDPRHMLLYFNISGLPTGAIIDSASLGVTVESGQNANRTVAIRQLTYGPWTEGTGGEGGNACTTGATWNAPNCTDTGASGGWNGSGGNFATAAPYGPQIGANISPAIDEQTYWTDVTSVVSAWNQGTSTNYGFALLANGTDTGTVKFHSRTGVAGKEPQLLISYHYPSTIPANLTVRDGFTTATFSNNTGTTTWSTSWVENDSKHVGQDPGNGDIQVNAGVAAAGYLSFKTEKDDTADNVQSIYRQADLSGPVTAAVLSYDLITNGVDANETILVQASNNGGSTWTTLQTIDQSTATGLRSYNLLTALGSVSAQTRVRVVQTAADSDGKELRFDYFQIDWTLTPGPGGTSSLSAAPTLVSAGDTVTLTMTVASAGQLNNITPTTPTVTDVVGGAGCASITGVDTTPKSIGASGGSVTFSWTCTATASVTPTAPASVAFQMTATAIDQYGRAANFSTTKSNSVLVPPSLVYRVKVVTSPTVAEILNTAQWSWSIGGTPFSSASNLVKTKINSTDAQNDINQTPVNVPVSGSVATNDTDLQGDTQAITSFLVAKGADGVVNDSLAFNTPTTIYGTNDAGSIVVAGTLTLHPDGSYDYIPALDFTGTVPAIYTVTDNNSLPVSDSATLTIEVFGDTPLVNDPPVAQDDTASTVTGVAVGANLIYANDSDPDGDALLVNAVLVDSDGDGFVDDTLTLGVAAIAVYGKNTAGSVVPAGTMYADGFGNYVFTPNATFVGEVLLDYSVKDPSNLTDSARLTITVTPLGGNVTFTNDDANSGPQDVNQTGNVITNDFDPEGSDQDVTLIDTNGDGTPDTAPVAGTPNTITQGGVVIGTLTVNPQTGAYIWDPEPDYVGTAVVPYTATDGAATDTATLYLTTLPGIDFGDAPASYGAAAAIVDDSLRIGADVTFETASRDDDTDADDGLDFSTAAVTTDGYSLDVAVTNTTGQSVWVCGWIDTNSNGQFESTERQCDEVQVGEPTATLTWTDVGGLSGSSFSRFRVAPTLLGASSPTGAAGIGEVEDYPIDLATLPVTVAYFSSNTAGGNLVVTWWSGTETGNAGYVVYGESPEGGPVALTGLILGAGDSFTPLEYTQTIPGGYDTLWLADVDLTGVETLHGPYEVGRTVGKVPAPVPLEWEQARAVADSAEQAADAGRSDQQSRAIAESAVRAEAIAAYNAIGTGSSIANIESIGAGQAAALRVDRAGLHRVTFEQMLAAGLDWTGVEMANLAVTDSSGEPVPYRKSAGTTFGPGSSIVFWGEPLDTLYTGTNVYHLVVDRSLRLRLRTDRARVPKHNVDTATSHVHTVVAAEQNLYSVSAPGDDPWYGFNMFSFGLPQETIIELDHVESGPGTVAVKMWGVFDFAPADDHLVSVAVNGVDVGEIEFGGTSAAVLTASVPDGVLVEGANTVTVTVHVVPGMPYDWVNLDEVAVSYPRRIVAVDGTANFTASADRIVVAGLESRNVRILRFDRAGVARVARSRAFQQPDGTYEIAFAGTGAEAIYAVTQLSSAAVADIAPARIATGLLDGDADLLIISHSAFSDHLGDLVAAREAQGLDVKIVEVEDVYAAYSGEVFDPAAISAYIADAAVAFDDPAVLLVGADSYDYRDYGGTGSMSFIPTIYGDVGIGGIAWSPIDPAFVDLDHDRVPDLALGRFPVRDLDELSNAIDKAINYTPDTAALFASDTGYGRTTDELAGLLPDGYAHTTAHLDDLAVADARNVLLSGIDDGAGLTVFFGHSSTDQWTAEGLLTTSDVAAMTNTDDPTLVVQFGCWNTYFSDPAQQSLGSALVTSPAGAAAVLGATTLTSEVHDAMFGRFIMDVVTSSDTIGDALTTAKRNLNSATSAPDITMGWTLLGDPTIPLN